MKRDPTTLTRLAMLWTTVVLAVMATATATPATGPSGAGLTDPAFTLEQVMGYAFPTDLVAAPGDDRIAWIANREGRRNVWVAAAPDWEARRLTSYMEDDGQELGGLRFTPDGERLVYRRGGSPNRDGDLPNPTSEIDGVSRDLWMIDWSGGEPVRVAGASSPIMSPTGNRLVWARDGSAWLLDLDDPEHEAEEILQVRSGLDELRWSPDGSRLAFISSRDGRAILGVFDLESRELRWLTNSADRDDQPRWSPDGSRIAFLRHLTGHDGFSVWTVAADGDEDGDEARELWRAPDQERGAYPRSIAGSYELMYGDGWLVFAGEWSGWNHLYALPEDGGEPRDLTPGDGIVENATLSRDGRSVWVSTNIESIDHRWLGRVDLASGEVDWVEDGGAIAWNPAPGPDDRWIAYIRSNAREPASVHLRRRARAGGAPEARGGRDGSPAISSRVSELPDDFPMDELVEPRQVVFPAADGLEIHGQLFLPTGLAADAGESETEGRRVAEGESEASDGGEAGDGGEAVDGSGSEDGRALAVIFMHGGSRRQMMLGWHNRGYYHGAYGFNQYLAAKGYVVLSVNYRSGIGYGVDFREPEDYGWRGASEYQDIVAAGRYLQSRADVDPERIGLWGGSYGGYLTAMGLARDSELFKAGVDLHGVHDWSEQLRWYGRGEIRAPSEAERDRTAQVAFASSPVADIDSWTSPVLIVHGDDDRNVPFEASIDLVARLRDKGDVHFEELYLVDEVHGFLRHESWMTVFRAAADFFDRQLAGEDDRDTSR